MKNKNITERMEEMNEVLREHVESTVRKIGTNLDQEITSKFMIPKFTVRGEHNVWHVYENDNRLEPPFRNQERAEIERAHHERCHAIRKGYNQEPNKGV